MKKRNLFGKSFSKHLPPLHHVCSTDELRENLNCVHIENGIATATDANCLVRYDLKGILDETVLYVMNGKLIHRRAWELMCSGPALFICTDEAHNVYIKHFNNIPSAKLYIPFVNEKYPDFHQITGPIFSGELIEAKERISFNLMILNKIGKVLSHEVPGERFQNQMRFWFNQSDKAIAVTNTSNDDGVAILMPVHWESNLNDRNIFAPFTQPKP